KAYVDSGARVNAHGSIRIGADEHSQMDIVADSSGLSFVASAGASLAVGWTTKITEAFIAGVDDTRADPLNAGHTLGAASVTADRATPLNVATGDFNITFGLDSTYDPDGIRPPAEDIATALAPLTGSPVFAAISGAVSDLLGLTTVVDAPPLDITLIKQRI